MRSKSLQCLSNFKFDVAAMFLKENGFMQRNNSKGYKFFCEGYVHDTWTFCGDINIEVKAKCYKSQKKNDDPHRLCLIMQKGSNNIIDANCSCEAGASRSCNHIVALCYNLQHWVLKGYPEIPEDFTCTDLPQQWNKPRGPKINSENVMNVAFACPNTMDRKKKPIHCTLYNACDTGPISAEAILEATSKLSGIDDRIPFSYLARSTSCNKPVRLALNITAAEHSVISYQLKNFKSPMEMTTNVTENASIANSFLSFPIVCSVTTNIFFSVPPFDMEFTQVDLESSYKLEQATREQSKCPLWHYEKSKRFTASHFGELCHRKKIITDKFLNRMLFSKNINFIPAVADGNKYESVAKQHYLLHKNGSVQLFKSGLVVHPHASYLGASPDAHVFDTSSIEAPNGVLEVKCPAWSTLEDGINQKISCLESVNNVVSLKRSSNYYYQVQGQILICGVQWCDFVVFVHKSEELFVERIYFDAGFCTNMLHKIYQIYVSHVPNKILNADQNSQNVLNI